MIFVGRFFNNQLQVVRNGEIILYDVESCFNLNALKDAVVIGEEADNVITAKDIFPITRESKYIKEHDLFIASKLIKETPISNALMAEVVANKERYRLMIKDTIRHPYIRELYNVFVVEETTMDLKNNLVYKVKQIS